MRNFYKNLKNLILLTILLLGSVNAWSTTVTRSWQAGVAVNQGEGTVKVTIYKHDWGLPDVESRYTVGSNATKTSNNSTVQTATDSESQSAITSIGAETKISYRSCWYEVVSVSDGYSWLGWYDGSGNQKTTNQTYKPWTKTKDNKNETYYAKFNPVTVNSVSSNPISTSETALKFTAPGKQTAEIKFTVSSNADATADFNTPTVSGAGWSLDSCSLSGTTVTVKVKYTASQTTTQGDHTATVTLTSKGTSDKQSQSTTVFANVDLTPTLGVDKTSLDFGMFTVGVDSKKQQNVVLTPNVNAINFSSNGSYPFTTSVGTENNQKVLAIFFEPNDAGDFSTTVTVTAKNNQSPQLSVTKTITVTGKAQNMTNPTYTCNIADSYMVDDATIDLQSLWTSTSDGAITYSIEKYTEHGSNNSASTKPAITDNRYLSLGRACEIKLKLTQASATNYYEGSATKTITISKYETSFDGSAYNLMVDGVQTADYSWTNTSAAQPTANSNDDFYYTIDNVSFTNSAKNKGTNLVTFDPATKKITACNAGTAKITLHQKETYKYTGATKSFDVAVYKYKSTFSGAANLGVKVEETKDASYTLTYSKPNNAYIGTVPVAGDPSLNSGDYYYSLTQNVTSTNTTGSADATIAATYDAGTKKATGKNAGTCTVNLYQAENYKFNPANTSFEVTVTKNDNTLYVNGSTSYYPTMYADKTLDVTMTSTNTDYTNCPIEVNLASSGNNAELAYTQNTRTGVVSSNNQLGDETWNIHQAANYKYKEANGSFGVKVKKADEVTCYIVNQSSARTVSNIGEIPLDGVGETLTFEIDNNGLGYNAILSTYNGSSWSDEQVSAEAFSDYVTRTKSLNSDVTKIKFAKKGTDDPYVKNIKVTRKTYLNASDLTIDKTSSNSPIYPSDGTGVGSLKIDYSIANGGDLKILNDNSKFTLSETTISNVDCKTDSKTITINYESAVAGTDYAHLLIYNDVYRKEVTITGVTVKKSPTVTWSPDASIFNVEDVLSATNANGLTVTLSVEEADAAYVACNGNTATMINTKSGSVTIKAHVAGNEIFKDADFTKDVTITNKTKQSISWDQDFSRLKTTNASKSVTLNATASSNLPVTYKLEGDATGLTLTQNGNTWTLTYSASECKNTTIVAMQAGNDEYAPAPNFSLPVKVIDPTKECDVTTTLVNSSTELKYTEQVINLDIPEEITISVKRTNTEWYAVYAGGFKVEFYDGKNGTGNKVGDTHSYSKDDINTSKTITIKNLDRNIKSVKLISEALYGYTITNALYKQQKYCETDKKTLDFVTNPNTETSPLTFTVNYANYPISLECLNNKFTISPKDFGDCGEKGTQTVSVFYTAGADEGTDNGNIIYIKDNTGTVLEKCTLNVTIKKLTQGIETTNIANSYNTTDRVELSATTNSGLSNFTYSVSPSDVATISGNVMTFLKSGTITITVREAGSNVYKPCSTTVANVVVNKVTPTLTLPTGTNATYLQNLSTSTLSGGKATVTLRGVENTEVAGSFAWTNGSAQTNSASGNSSFEVTFTPDDKGMYNSATGMVTVTVEKANQSIVMNNGTVSVAVDKGLDANSADSKLNLTSLIASQTMDAFDANRTGAVTFEVISSNSANATISGTIFSAAAEGTYTIRATKAATNYYNAATAEFTVTANARTNNLSIAGACTRYVDQEVENVLSNINSDAAIQTISTDESIAYYDIENNKIVIPNSEAKSFNDTTVTITILQNANARFAASEEKTIVVTVKKYDNQIYKSWATWSQTLNFDQKIPVRLWSDNSETALEINQTGDASIATYYAYPSVDKDTIRAWYSVGTTTWSISQAETYKYKAAQAKTLTVNVQTLTSGDCYVLNETAEYDLFGVLGVGTGDAMALSAPGKDLYFDAKRDAAGANYFFIEYSTNGSQYTVLGEEVQLGISYKTYGPYELPEGTTHIRFKTTTGATLHKYYKNVHVTRKKTFDLEDKDGAKISTLNMPLNIVSVDPVNINSAKKSFWVDYNTCADEIRIASNHPYYTVKETDKRIDVSATSGVGRREIEVTYTCATSDTSTAIISVYTKYEHKTITVNGRTNKGTQELIWKQPDFVTDTVSLPIGYKGIAATASSKLPLKYSIEQGEDSVIQIADDEYSFEVVGFGTAHLTVTQEGTETLYPVTGMRVINATSKKLQAIRWFQNLSNTLTEGKTIRLNAAVYVMNSKTGVYERDDARTDSIRYTCTGENGIIELFGRDSLRVIGIGETSITASVAGNEFYEEASSVTMPVRIHAQGGNCPDKLLVDQPQQQEFKPSIDWGFSGLSLTKAEYGETILIDQTVGKPDKLSFWHTGEAFTILGKEYYQGYVKAQQRIRGAWEDVNGSRVAPTKGVWDECSVSLNEDADAIRIMREENAYGTHFVKDVQVTMLPYIRSVDTVFLGGEVGAKLDTVITVQYANAKSSLESRTVSSADSIFSITDNSTIYPECGTIGSYDLRIHFEPQKAGPWMDAVIIKDSGSEDSIIVYVSAIVKAASVFVYESDTIGGTWGDDNWGQGGKQPNENDHVQIKSDVVIPADTTVYVKSLAVIKETATVLVKGHLVIMESTPDQANYGNIHVAESGSLDLSHITEGGVKINNFILDAKLGETNGNSTSASSSGQISNESKLIVNGEAYFRLALDPSGRVTLGWYDFVLPFEVDVVGGISVENAPVPLQYNVNYSVMDYSEAKRAVNGKCWNRFSGTMLPGKAYTIALDDAYDWNTVIFKKNQGAAVTGNSSYTTTVSAGDSQDKGWNGFGNATLHHTKLNVPEGTLIQMYDHKNRCYWPREAYGYTIPVGLSFFMQFNKDTTITMDPASGSLFRAPAQAPRQINKFRLALKEEGAENAADNLWVSANEGATGEYVIGHDVLKMGTINESQVARMWSERNDITLCSNDMPMRSNKANCNIGLYAPQSGTYSIEVEATPADATLYLTYNNRVIWNLSMSPYEIELNQGTTEGYGLRIVATQQTTTDLENDGLVNEANGVRKVLIDDKIYMITPEGAMFDVLGKSVKY